MSDRKFRLGNISLLTLGALVVASGVLILVLVDDLNAPLSRWPLPAWLGGTFCIVAGVLSIGAGNRRWLNGNP